jgi:ABC-type multidrug transport system fused ATPase/permease subunit
MSVNPKHSVVLQGLATIKSFRKEEMHRERMAKFIDSSSVMQLCIQSMNRWLSLRLETIGALVSFAAAALAIEHHGAASWAGLTLSYALQLTSLTNMTVCSWSMFLLAACSRYHAWSLGLSSHVSVISHALDSVVQCVHPCLSSNLAQCLVSAMFSPYILPSHITLILAFPGDCDPVSYDKRVGKCFWHPQCCHGHQPACLAMPLCACSLPYVCHVRL